MSQNISDCISTLIMYNLVKDYSMEEMHASIIIQSENTAS